MMEKNPMKSITEVFLGVAEYLCVAPLGQSSEK